MTDITSHHPIKKWYDAYGWEYGEKSPGQVEEAYYRGLYVKYMLSMTDWTDKHVLDLGCGTGRVGRCLNGIPKQVVGIDFSAAMLAAASESGEILALMDANRLGFRDQAFDIVTAIGSLEHQKDLKCVLTEAARVLTENGRIIFSFHNKSIPVEIYRRLKSLCGVKRKKSFSPRIYSLNEVTGIARMAGLRMEDIYATYFFPVELFSIIHDRWPASVVSRGILSSILRLTDAMNRFSILKNYGGVYIACMKKETELC